MRCGDHGARSRKPPCMIAAALAGVVSWNNVSGTPTVSCGLSDVDLLPVDPAELLRRPHRTVHDGPHQFQSGACCDPNSRAMILAASRRVQPWFAIRSMN